MPFLSEFVFNERCGGTFWDAYETPRRVRAYYLLYASILDGWRKLQQEAAGRKPGG